MSLVGFPFCLFFRRHTIYSYVISFLSLIIRILSFSSLFHWKLSIGVYNIRTYPLWMSFDSDSDIKIQLPQMFPFYQSKKQSTSIYLFRHGSFPIKSVSAVGGFCAYSYFPYVRTYLRTHVLREPRWKTQCLKKPRKTTILKSPEKAIYYKVLWWWQRLNWLESSLSRFSTDSGILSNSGWNFMVGASTYIGT